jgi:polar amino acid transport system substrate-binding protein
MKQIVQDLKTGEIKVVEVPAPTPQPGHLLVRNRFSALSPGTERVGVRSSSLSLIERIRERPELIKRGIEVLRERGVGEIVDRIRGIGKGFKPLGYSSAGYVIEIGGDVEGFNIGDKVACAGVGYACHAEIISVPQNLCVRVPKNVKLENASFVALGSIAIQGLRQAGVTLGECVGVIGLGILGQLTVQLLKACGCRILAIDLDPERVKLSLEMGADLAGIPEKNDAEDMAFNLSNGYGLDAVIITAGTESSEPVQLSARMLRDRGRVIVVGDVGMELDRRVFYEKELELKLSRSYGPGRYDPLYEEKGFDYPIGYVRWTEGRNMEEFLRLISDGKIHLERLITHVFPIDESDKAYNLILGKEKERYMGILIEYPEKEIKVGELIRVRGKDVRGKTVTSVNLGVIGAGNFARTHLLPYLMKRVNFVGVANATGSSAKAVAERFGFSYCTTDYRRIIEDEEINAILVATRHDLHAKIVEEILSHGKPVFVEKPLAINEDELKKVIDTYRNSSNPWLMIGFNRRFSPHTKWVKEFLGKKLGPYVINYRVNAGYIPKTHWVQDKGVGGGRIIGEVCHFVDFIQFITGEKPVSVYAKKIKTEDKRIVEEDNIEIILSMEDGSIASISYISVGDSSYPKERIEIFGDGKVAVIEDFRESRLYSGGKKRIFKTSKVDKGHREEMETFIDSILGGLSPPIPFEDMVITSLTTFRIIDSLKGDEPQPISNR